MLPQLLYDVRNGLRGAAWSPVRHRDSLGDAETQERLVYTGQRLLGKGKARREGRMRVDDCLHVAPFAIDARVHPDNLTRSRIEVSLHHLAIKGNDHQLLRCQVSNVAYRREQELLFFRQTHAHIPMSAMR